MMAHTIWTEMVFIFWLTKPTKTMPQAHLGALASCPPADRSEAMMTLPSGHQTMSAAIFGGYHWERGLGAVLLKLLGRDQGCC